MKAQDFTHVLVIDPQAKGLKMTRLLLPAIATIALVKGVAIGLSVAAAVSVCLCRNLRTGERRQPSEEGQPKDQTG